MTDCRHRGKLRLYDPAPLLTLVAPGTGEARAEQLGVHRVQLARYVSGKTWLTPSLADRLATRLHRHPDEIWDDWGQPCCEETEPTHGTRGAYNNGCHCDPCTEANRVYINNYNGREKS